tara:strand:+ start:40175 stop:41284 length:1110 start_codon:yes stop_codon:yes gene_type:complete
VKYYIISGEASGDLHSSKLISNLNRLDPMAEFRGWGGDLMEKEGAILVKHYKELAFMGFWEVISHLHILLSNISLCKKDILQYSPDVIIYVDYPGFNLRIAKWAKKKGFKNHYYISPQVWAWKENRVKTMKRFLDALYVILPFEKSYFEERHQFPVNFVGHPIMDQLHKYEKNKNFFEANKLNSKKPIIALLPGSRFQEIKKMLPLFIQVSAHYRKYQFIIAGAPGINEKIYNKFIKSSTLKIIFEQTYDLLDNSLAAIVTSGTATLETAIFNVPQIVCYRSSYLSYWIGKKVVNLKYISLVNLILEKDAVVELIQDKCKFENLDYQLKQLLKKNSREKINQDYQLLKGKLGGIGASEKTANLIFNAIN